MQFEELKAQLDGLTGEVRVKAERKALRAVGDLFKDAIVELAPVQSETPHGDLAPGELKADINARVHVASDQGVTTGDTSKVTIGPSPKTAYVANWVENGHAGRRSATREGPARNVPAHPFVRPAFDANEAKAIDLYADTMTTEISAAME